MDGGGNKNGRTALHTAEAGGHLEAVRLLQDRGMTSLFKAGNQDINSLLFGSGV